MSCLTWLEANSQAISGIANIGTTVAALVVAGTLVVTFLQLKYVRKQFEYAALALRASSAFQISQEGRHISRYLQKDMTNNVGYAFSFMHSAWYQHKIGALDRSLWVPIEAEIRDFLTLPEAKQFMNGDRMSMYSTEFVEYLRTTQEQSPSASPQ